MKLFKQIKVGEEFTVREKKYVRIENIMKNCCNVAYNCQEVETQENAYFANDTSVE